MLLLKTKRPSWRGVTFGYLICWLVLVLKSGLRYIIKSYLFEARVTRCTVCSNYPVATVSTVCKVNIAEMNRRLNTSNPVYLMDVCSASRPTSRLTTPDRSSSTRRDVITPTILNAVDLVSSTVHDHSASRSVAVTASRPTANAASDAPSRQVIIVWNFVGCNNTTDSQTVAILWCSFRGQALAWRRLDAQFLWPCPWSWPWELQWQFLASSSNSRKNNKLILVIIIN